MIDIRFMGSAKEVRDEMTEFLGFGPTLNQPVTTETTPPKPRGRGKAAATPTEPAPGEADAGNAAETVAQVAAIAAAASPPATTAASPSELRDQVRTKGVQYGMPHNGGQGALKELLTQFGSTTGKFSGVPDDQLAALGARLDELLTDAK